MVFGGNTRGVQERLATIYVFLLAYMEIMYYYRTTNTVSVIVNYRCERQ